MQMDDDEEDRGRRHEPPQPIKSYSSMVDEDRGSFSSNSSGNAVAFRNNSQHHEQMCNTILHQTLSMEADGNNSRLFKSTSPQVTNILTSQSTIIKLSLALVFGGAVLGTILPKNQHLPSPTWQITSSIIGYTYFLAWSTSFYPQLFMNHQRRTTRGLSVDFCVLNVLGYVCYTLYTTNFYFNQNVIDAYRERMADANQDTKQSTVQGNDVAFAIHALIMATVTLSQISIYDTFALRPPSKRVYVILSSAFAFCTGYVFFTRVHYGSIDLLGLLYVFGTIKIGVTIGKYIPQMLLNRSRKSTVGWNVLNVILDLTGGVLSLLQLIGDCAGLSDWSGITGNPAKMALALVTICFDLIFLVQHYLLYPESGEVQSYSAVPTIQTK
eukprot:g5415.t1 g5415   contig2:492961-494109(-)